MQTYQRGRKKLYLWFQLVTPGQWEGREFFMVCNVPANGRWGPSHKFWNAYVLAFGEQPRRRDRMSTAVFRGKVFRARFRKVLFDYRQRKRTLEQQYSVIDVLLEKVAG
jgi:hypothetical protein